MQTLGFERWGWPAYDSYELAGDEIKATGTRARWYYPLDFPELPEALARVARADEGEAAQSALKFVRRYGLLGWAEITSPARYPVLDEPVAHVLAHARTVNDCLSLYKAISDCDRRSLDTLLRAMLKQSSGSSVFNWTYRVGARDFKSPFVAPGSTPELTAAWMVREAISRNLGAAPMLSVGGRAPTPKFRLEFRFGCLADAIYYSLAHKITSGVLILNCAGCGALYERQDGRQTYCSPACSDRTRQRRKRTPLKGGRK